MNHWINEFIKQFASLDKIQNMAIEYHLADTKPELIKNLILKIKNAGFKIKTGPHYDDMGFLIARK